MNKEKSPKKEKRNIVSQKKSMSNQDIKKKIDELVSLLFEEKSRTTKERKDK